MCAPKFAKGAPVTGRMIGMGIVLRFGGPKKESEDAIRQLGDSLGFRCSRPGKKEGPTLRGVIDGYKVKVRTSSKNQCRIEVDYKSGVRDFSIHRRSSNLLTNRIDVLTEDEQFDSQFRLMTRADIQPGDVLNYLTAQRRQIVSALGAAFSDVAVKDDEIDVRMPADISIDQMRNAIETCVLAAKGLDRSTSPQDAVQRAV